MPAFKDLTGQMFGRFIVIERAENNYRNHAQWLVECSCAARTRKVVRGDSLISGNTISCNCAKQTPHITHGLSKSREYSTWEGMVTSCTNPKATRHEHYFDAGVRVCEKWLNSFEAFLEDMGERPEGTTLGRFGDIGNYEPENCAWQTDAEQKFEQKTKRQLQFVAA